MSARITQESATATVHPYYIDDRGYMYCIDCVETLSMDVVCETSKTYASEPCDHCGKAGSERPARTIQGTAIVEHFTCRIY